MRPIKLLSLVAALVFGMLSVAEDASAQGILRRILERRGVVLPRQPEPGANLQNRSNKTPASPYQSNRPETNSQNTPTGAGSSAQYRNQQGRRLSGPGYGSNSSQQRSSPDGRSPTLAIPPSQVAQTSANEPADGSGNNFGQSILRPLDFEEEKNATPPKTNSATLGIQAINANPGYPGVKILQFKPHSLADDAGLSVGDYIFAINGVATPSVGDLAREVAKYSPGQEVRFRVGMDGRVSDIDVQIVARPNTPSGQNATSPPPTNADTSSAGMNMELPASSPTPAAPRSMRGPSLGADVRDIDGMRGVVVTALEPGQPAKLSGLKLEDRIIAINGLLISGTQDLVAQLNQLPPDQPIQVRLIRDSQLVDMTVSFDGSSAIASNGQPASTADDTAKKPSGGGLLGGFGSMLGGVFSGNGNSEPAKEKADQPTPSDAEPEKPKASKRKAAAKKLPIELPTPIAELLPPAISPKPIKEDESESDDGDNAALKAEIQRLKDQLKSLEEKVSQ